MRDNDQEARAIRSRGARTTYKAGSNRQADGASAGETCGSLQSHGCEAGQGTWQPLGSATIRKIGPVSVRSTDMPNATAEVLSAIRGRTHQIFAFCNMHTFNIAFRSPQVARALACATIYNDGLGMDLASKIIFGERFTENLNGTDFTPAVLRALDQPTSIYLLGSAPGVAEVAGQTLERMYANCIVVGTHHGFLSPEEDGEVADEIKRLGADLVLVGMGNPRQEIWAAENAQRCGAVVLCIGAFLDFTAGIVPRAPKLLRRIRCEWIFRIGVEPRRLSKRYLIGGWTFLAAVLALRREARLAGGGD